MDYHSAEDPMVLSFVLEIIKLINFVSPTENFFCRGEYKRDIYNPVGLIFAEFPYLISKFTCSTFTHASLKKSSESVSG